MRKFMLAVAALVVSSAIGAHAEVQKKDVDIKAPDGVKLKGTYLSPGRPGPAMLLLHQCNMDRHAWDGLASDLANAGVHVLTLNFRGYGESGGERSQDRATQQTIVREKWPGDVDAAYAFLLAQKEVDRARVAAGGASCGVGQAASLAARQPEIKTLMMLSSSTAEASKDYITNTPALAVFGGASEGDERSAASIKAALGASKNSDSVLKIYPGAEHGVPMFDKNPELRPMIVNWLKAQLRVKTGS